MDRIPPEILCDIFLAALPHPTDPDEYPSSVVAPLHISHVCRAWRTFSLSFGELWSYLCIVYSMRRRMKATVSVFDTWIERTNGAPLNFRVECYCKAHNDKAVHRVAEHIVTTMISHQHRWRDVSFTFWEVQLSREFSGLNLINMPILTSLELRVALPLRCKISISQSSRLRRLCIRARDFELITGEGPLYSLTESADICFEHDCARRYDIRVWLDVLKAAPFLTEFIANSRRYSVLMLRRPENEPLTRVPNLRVLKLLRIDVDSDTASFIVDYVTLPNLQVLFFESSRYDEDVKAEMLTSFIRRSLPPLTTLVLDWDDVHEETIIPIFRLLPTLKYVRLDGAIVTRRFFHELTAPSITDDNSLLGDEHATACPVLETLFLHWVDIEEDSALWVALIAMLKSRPRGLGKSNFTYLWDSEDNVPTTVELSDLDENNVESRREVKDYVREYGMVIGNYEVVKSLLLIYGS